MKMSENNGKGFGKVAPLHKLTKSDVMKQNESLQGAVTQMQQTVQFLGQQIWQQMQKAQLVEKEVQAMAELLRMDSFSGPFADGDKVMIDFVGKLKETGKIFRGSFALGSVVGIGSGMMIPGFEDALVGTSAGDTKEISVVFPKDYGKELSEKEATFTVKVIKGWKASPYSNEISDIYDSLVAVEQAAARKAYEDKIAGLKAANYEELSNEDKALLDAYLAKEAAAEKAKADAGESVQA